MINSKAVFLNGNRRQLNSAKLNKEINTTETFAGAFMVAAK